MYKVSPKYQMDLVLSVHKKLFELYGSYTNVEAYVEKWREEYDNYGNANFYIIYKDDERKTIDLSKTLHKIDGETLLKMAIDLGIETPDFIPAIPTFKNELKSSYTTAAQTFEKAYHNVEKDPSLAISLANSALESIIKEILKDERLQLQDSSKDTLSKLIKHICKTFGISNNSLPQEIQTICSSLIACSSAIEKIRSSKTEVHGKINGDVIITEPLYAYLVVNAVSTVGLFLLNYYKENYPSTSNDTINTLWSDDLPF